MDVDDNKRLKLENTRVREAYKKLQERYIINTNELLGTKRKKEQLEQRLEQEKVRLLKRDEAFEVLKCENVNLRVELNCKDEQLEKLQSEKTVLGVRFKHADDRIENYKVKIQQLQAKIEAFKATIAVQDGLLGIKRGKEQLQTQEEGQLLCELRRRDEACKILKCESANLQLELNGKDVQLKKLESEKKELDDLNESLNVKIQEFQAEIKAFKVTIVEKDGQISILKEANLRKSVRETLNKNEKLKRANSVLEGKPPRFQQEFGECSQKTFKSLRLEDNSVSVERLQRDFNLLKEENSRHLTCVAKLEKTIEENNLSYKKEKEAWEAKQEELAGEVKRLKSADDMVKTMKEMQEQKAEAGSLQKWKQENDHLRQQNERMKQENKKATVERYKTLLQSALEKNSELKQKLEVNGAQSATGDKAQQKLRELEEEKCKLKQELFKANQEIRFMKSKLTESSRLEQEDQQLKNNLQDQIDILVAQVREKVIFEEERRTRQHAEELVDDFRSCKDHLSDCGVEGGEWVFRRKDDITNHRTTDQDTTDRVGYNVTLGVNLGPISINVSRVINL